MDGRISRGENRLKYGPNDRLQLTGVSGEIATSGRSLIRLHGGRQEEEVRIEIPLTNAEGVVMLDDEGNPRIARVMTVYREIANPKLKCTYGCLRIWDEDVSQLQELTQDLESNNSGETPGLLKVQADLKKYGGKYYTPDDYQELRSLETELFKKTQSMSRGGSTEASKSDGLQKKILDIINNRSIE